MSHDSDLFDIWKWEHATPIRPSKDQLAQETPLEIRLRGKPIALTMRTPGHDEELAVGFLLSESVIKSPADLDRIEPCPREDANLVNVILAPHVHVDFTRLTRHVFASSSCGVCGKATIDSLTQTFPTLNDTLRTTPQVLTSLPQKMLAAQETFARTGGLHAAALFDPAGNLLVLREDVGRHNAVDKVLGWSFSQKDPPFNTILLVSGRASFEIVQKAIAGKVQLVAAVSAPSSLAVELARSANLTLVAFLKSDRFNLYAHPQRVSNVS
jgi:FdhD protein